MTTELEDRGNRSPHGGRAGDEGLRGEAPGATPAGAGDARVAEVRRSLAEGTYRVNHRRVAERIVQLDDVTRL